MNASGDARGVLEQTHRTDPCREHRIRVSRRAFEISNVQHDGRVAMSAVDREGDERGVDHGDLLERGSAGYHHETTTA